MRRTKQTRTLIIVSVIALVFFCAVGYAGYTASLKINAKYSVDENFSVKITDIQTKNIGGHAINNETPSFDGTTASFDANLYLPGDYIEYTIYVTNTGNVDAYLTGITPTNSTAPAIIFSYSGITKNDPIPANSEKTFVVRVEYDVNVTEQPEVLTSDYDLNLNFADSPSEDSVTTSVYRWTNDQLYVGDSIEGVSTTTDPSTLGKTFYLKHDIENNLITASYVCFVTDAEYCMQGGSASFYQSNVGVLQTNETWFNSNDGGCSFGDSGSSCVNLYFSNGVGADDDGSVKVMAGTDYCGVDYDGSSYCAIIDIEGMG